jgi:hypothetical protein
MSRIIMYRYWDEYKKAVINCDQIIASRNDGGMTAGYFDESGCPKGCADTLMQFTGLKDKFNRDIYEGDLVAAKSTAYYVAKKRWDKRSKDCWEVLKTGEISIHGIWEIVWNQDDARFHTKYLSSDFPEDRELYTAPCLSVCKNSIENCEVIGNIYENKDLIAFITKEEL